MDAACAFYGETLGLKPVHTSPHWSDFELGAFRLGLHPPLPGSAAPLGARDKGWRLSLETRDLAALLDRLRAAGVEPGAPHDVPGGAVVGFSDLDGNPLQAFQANVTAADLA